ncbi:MAG: class I SAM-dependent methyltransferase [Verrucomicrobia bacterium]|nr:class I SAM-dependent methyltransferase [Verrucomicrobiota bacterium]
MSKRLTRPGVRAGYDLWSASYDQTPNPLVALDRRHTMALLQPHPGERILDAGCGTGGHFDFMLGHGSKPVGLDFSREMLRLAQRKHPGIPLVQADLNDQLPFRTHAFDAALCALVGEHLIGLSTLFRGLAASLARSGRLVFSVFHPAMAAAGTEANFERGGVEYRLGAERHTVDDYLDLIDEAGLDLVNVREFCGDPKLVEEIPSASKYLGRPLLLTVEARKASNR